MSVSAALVPHRIFHFIRFRYKLFLFFSFDVLHDLLESARRRRSEQRVVLRFTADNVPFLSLIQFHFHTLFYLRHFAHFVIEKIVSSAFSGHIHGCSHCSAPFIIFIAFSFNSSDFFRITFIRFRLRVHNNCQMLARKLILIFLYIYKNRYEW